ASVELEFTYSQNGEQHTYKVTRSWKRGKKDTLYLEKDGLQMPELNYEQCQGFLNELIPVGIADLFFFDGEKIAELAEDESGTVLKTAVRRLLGLDVIAKLKSDLNIFLKKQGVSTLRKSLKEEMDSLDKRRITHERNAEKLRGEADLVDTQIELVSRDILNLEQKLSQNGGAWAKTRENEQQKVDALLKEKVELEKQIRMEMESSLPFMLAPKAMQRLQAQIEHEQEIKKKQNFGNELDSFLETLRARCPSFGSESAQSAIADSLKTYVGEFNSAALLFDISDSQANTIDYQLSNLSKHSFDRFDEARHRLQTIEEELDNAATNIARAPEQEQVQELFAGVRKLDKKKEQLIIKYHALLEEAKRELRQAIETARQLQRLHDKNKDQSNKDQSVQNAQSSILLLEKFAQQLTKSRVAQLEKEFVQSYKKLARKKDLQLTASINPMSFDVELMDEH
ncbi:MAG: DNA sulfur modification protein DndD, partial [Enterovibrio sp.]